MAEATPTCSKFFLFLVAAWFGQLRGGPLRFLGFASSRAAKIYGDLAEIYGASPQFFATVSGLSFAHKTQRAKSEINVFGTPGPKSHLFERCSIGSHPRQTPPCGQASHDDDAADAQEPPRSHSRPCHLATIVVMMNMHIELSTCGTRRRPTPHLLDSDSVMIPSPWIPLPGRSHGEKAVDTHGHGWRQWRKHEITAT